MPVLGKNIDVSSQSKLFLTPLPCLRCMNKSVEQRGENLHGGESGSPAFHRVSQVALYKPSAFPTRLPPPGERHYLAALPQCRPPSLCKSTIMLLHPPTFSVKRSSLLPPKARETSVGVEGRHHTSLWSREHMLGGPRNHVLAAVLCALRPPRRSEIQLGLC